MKTVRDLHREAMALAQEALVYRERGELDKARELASQALPLEVEAATLVEKLIESEPTRSILYQSAASLAFQAGDNATAQRLAADGLSGFPPPRVQQELLEIIEQLNFHTHLEVTSDPLTDSEMQLSIVGESVGVGKVTYRDFDQHLSALMRMIDRTTRRKVGEPYRRSGPASAPARSFIPILSTPRPGSFTITVQLAHRPSGQRTLFTTSEDIINDIVESVEQVQENDLDNLKLRIGDESYFVNFMTQAQALAPDGNHVSMVGLTSSKRKVSLTQRKSAIEIPKENQLGRATHSTTDQFESSLTGILDEASSRGDEYIGLSVDKKRQYTLWVREGMDDIVRDNYNRLVEVRVRYQNGRTELLSLTRVEELE